MELEDINVTDSFIWIQASKAINIPLMTDLAASPKF